MKLRPSALALALIAAAAGIVGSVSPVSAAPSDPQNVASETYYDVDPAAGVIHVQANLTVRNNQSKDLPVLLLWAMPGATDLGVTRDGEPLQVSVKPILGDSVMPSAVYVTLPKPLKAKARVDLKLFYTVPPQRTELVRLEPGSMEGLLISQGGGSFVFVDVPADGDNYFDPGCLQVAEQPNAVRSAGKVRWVCGEATLIALASDDADTLKQCAMLDDRCRQRFNDSPFSAFMQSVTDPSLRGTLEADVQMSDKTVHLQLKYFKRDQAWAGRQFEVAKKAFPLLEQVYGFPYPHETVTMRQSHHIETIGAAGIAFSRIGEVLLATDTGIDEEVTIHELSHQWAGNQLETSWLWEGLAEYGTRVVAPQLGVALRDWGWERMGYRDPLATWHNGSTIKNSYYWYGKSGAFWFAYETALGGREAMRTVLSRIDDDPGKWPLDGEWFLDQGERVSGANLDTLYLTWVYNSDTSAPLLRERRAAHDSVKTLTDRAATLGLTGVPTDIVANLDDWAFNNIPAQIATANAVLDSYQAVLTLANDTGNVTPDAVAKSWGTETMSKTAGLVANQKAALQAIIAALGILEGQPPESRAWSRLAEAKEQYAAGAFGEAQRLASTSSTDVYNEGASARLMAQAKETRDAFKPNWLGKIGMLFANPEGDLAAAEAAYTAGEYGQALELSDSALKAWNGAESRGLLLLSVLCGLMAAVTLGTWWLLRRLADPEEARRAAAAGPETPGHVLTPADNGRISNWRDWENTR
ncbi:MAG: hypothetical protein HY875_04200 [Chloroflexi bacterium]|nr:hypothetical protein [Chloroflexota bacterium]